MTRHWITCLVVFALAGCADEPPQALGTLEYERIAVPAPVAEPIVAVAVHEGERVVAGQPLLQLQATRTQSTTAAARAEAQRQQQVLAELEAGARDEDIDRARALLSAAQAQARDAQAYFERLQPLGRQQLVAAADVDRARAAAENAQAQAHAAQAVLDELEHGARPQQLAQGRAAVRAAAARATAQEAVLDKLSVVAPRAGLVDSLPYELGDQAPVGAPLAILLVDDAPYARVYVPEPIRADVVVGSAARVFVDGREGALEGRVRMIRNEPSFTPYYALIGDDAARLSYLAEIELTGEDAEGLPAGLPVRVEFAADGEEEGNE